MYIAPVIFSVADLTEADGLTGVAVLAVLVAEVLRRVAIVVVSCLPLHYRGVATDKLAICNKSYLKRTLCQVSLGAERSGMVSWSIILYVSRVFISILMRNLHICCNVGTS